MGRWRILLLGWVLGAVGCMATPLERARDYNADGLFLYQQGDYAHARESFQAALQLLPEDVSLRYNLAQAKERLGHLKDAEQTYLTCLRQDPNHRESRQSLAKLLVKEGRRDDAVRLADEWLKTQPESPSGYTLDGWLWHQYGDLPRAQVRLQQALRFDPNDRVAQNELALIYEELHRPDRALALYERSLEQEPDQPDIIRKVNLLKSQGVQSPRPE